jgi:Secretion system C-terminal sorting domain
LQSRNEKKFYPNKKIAFLSALLLGLSALGNAQQISFPGAEGVGKYTTGGRGTATVPSTIYEVTNLNDDNNPGSFRHAVLATATYRTIVFRVSGTIHLTSKLSIKANTTIAGQTAPGDGICLADYPVSIGGSNVIVRFIRFRLGDKNQLITNPAGCGVPVAPFTGPCKPVDGSGGDDSFGALGHKNIMIDHCDMSWSNDEACTIYRGDSTTVQWCMMTEPLNYSYHFETGDTDFENHGYVGIWGGQHATFHHNLLAHSVGRNPRFDGSRNLGNGATAGLENADFVNNVIYNWGGYTTNGGEGGNYNIVNNYYKYGPNTGTGSSSGVAVRSMIANPYKLSSGALPWGKYFITGNYVDFSANITNNNWSGVAMSGGSLADTVASKVNTRFNLLSTNLQPATVAYNQILEKGGAYLPKRDTLDQRIISNVINRTGKIIDCQGGYPHATPYATTVNAWPTLQSTTAPADADHDGMPDEWETQRGLNPADATDRNAYNANGFSNLEISLNGDSIVAPGTINTCVAAKQITAANTGLWIEAKDTTYTRLVSTDTTNVIAGINDNGNFGPFNISYYTTATSRTDANGKPYLNRNITIAPVNPALITAPVTTRLYLSKAEYNVLKGLDNSISSVADLRIIRMAGSNCATTLGTAAESYTPFASGTYGTYQNGYYLDFATSNFGTFFITGKNTITAVISPVNEKNLKIFPNPVNHNLNIVSAYSYAISMDITDVSGKAILHSTKINKGNNSINIAAIPKGTYVLKFKIKNDTYLKKIVKQ